MHGQRNIKKYKGGLNVAVECFGLLCIWEASGSDLGLGAGILDFKVFIGNCKQIPE